MDSLCDNTGRIKPEPVRTKKTEYLRAVFYVGIGESLQYSKFVNSNKNI